MHPSVSTHVNQKQFINTIEDVKELVREFEGKNLYEEILTHHKRLRFKDSEEVITSRVRIMEILTIFAQVIPMAYE